jgi:hypothetical protein
MEICSPDGAQRNPGQLPRTLRSMRATGRHASSPLLFAAQPSLLRSFGWQAGFVRRLPAEALAKAGGHAKSPLFFMARGTPTSLLFPFGHNRRGRSAGQRYVFGCRLAAASPLAKRTRAGRRSIAAISVSRPALPETRPAWVLPTVSLSQSSRLPAERSIVPPGRGPGASRCRGYEPQQQAPHRRCRVYPISAQSRRSRHQHVSR